MEVMDIEQGLPQRRSTEENVSILLESYKSSETYKQVREIISTLCKQNGERLESKKGHTSFSTQCQVLTRRSFVNMHRDLGYYWLRFIVYIFLGFGLGTIFFDLGHSYNSIQVFKREKLNGHYGTAAFVVANTLSSMPYLILISLVPGAITYCLPGLKRDYQSFIYFDLVLFSCLMLVESIMMIVASIVPNFRMGVITGAGIQGLMILGAGFFRLPNDLPKPFWRYPLYYISFTKYAYQGLFKNEFEGLEIFENQGASLNMISGDVILKDTWQVETGYSKWVNLAVLLGMVVLYRLLFLIVIKCSEKLKPAFKAFVVSPSGAAS